MPLGGRVPALPAWRHGAVGVNCVIRCHHLRPVALASRAKLSHDAAVSGRGRWGPDAPTPPAPRRPAIGRCRNLEFSLFRLSSFGLPRYPHLEYSHFAAVLSASTLPQLRPERAEREGRTWQESRSTPESQRNVSLTVENWIAKRDSFSNGNG